MLNYLFFFLFIALGLGAPHTDPPKLADATSPAPTTTQAAPTDVVEIEAINNLPSTSVFCGMQEYTWSPNKISSAISQAISHPTGNYPKRWVNTGTLKWNCGGIAAASNVLEFPLMPGTTPTFDGTSPRLGRVYYSVSKTTVNPRVISTQTFYCGIARHVNLRRDFEWCNGATVASVAATPTPEADL